MLKLCSRCRALTADNAVECPRCGQLLFSSRAEERFETQTLDSSERRDATVLFCDLGGYTAWTSEEEPEEVAAVVDRFKRKAIQTLALHGGIVNQFVGDEVLGLFGVTISHEDDACRGVAAAMELHKFVREQETFHSDGRRRPLWLHSGIETGVVYTRIRDSRSGMYEVTGDAVNVAARLRAIARPDQILIGPATQRRVAPFFQLETCDPLTLRGKSEPIAPHRVIGPSTAATFFDAAVARGLTTYVDREGERDWLRTAWDEAQHGRGSVVAIAGPAGIGKTRLLHEFRNFVSSAAPDNIVLCGRCLSFGNIAPFHPFIDALLGFAMREVGRGDDQGGRLHAYFKSMPGVSEVSVRLLSHLVGFDSSRGLPEPSLSGEKLRDAMVDALSELIAALAQTRPVLIVLEDWHWADEPSRAALHQIAEQIQEIRALIAINYRQAELPENQSLPVHGLIELKPLDEKFTEAMGCGVLGASALPQGLAPFIYQRTLGNPFFMEEICLSLLERGACARRSGRLILLRPLEGLETPSTVQSMVRARVDRLNARQRQILRVASTIGLDFDLALLQALIAREPREDGKTTTAEELVGLLAELEAQGLVYAASSDIYRFKHAITQEVVYQGIPLHDRRAYHGYIAELLEQRYAREGLEPRYEALAHHYGLSLERHKGVAYAVRAGDKAWRTFSLDQADRQYRQALSLLDADRFPSDEGRRLRVDISVLLARIAVYNPQPELVGILRTSYEAARRLPYPHGACLCLNWMGWIEYALGNHASALECGQQFLESAQALNDGRLVAQALTNLGLSYAVATDYERALSHLEAGNRARARSTGTALGYSLGYLAMIYGDQGDFVRANALIAQATPIANAAGRITLEGPFLIQRGMVECWHGEWEQCASTARAAREIAERIDGGYIRAMSATLEAYATFMASGAVTQLAAMQDAASLLRERGIGLHLSWVYGLVSEVLARKGAHDEALAAVEAALARAACGDRLGEATALRVRGIVAGLDQDIVSAETDFQVALEAAVRKGSQRECALVYCDWAELMQRYGRRERAETFLSLALPALRRMQMRSHVERLERSGLATVVGTPA